MAPLPLVYVNAMGAALQYCYTEASELLDCCADEVSPLAAPLSTFVVGVCITPIHSKTQSGALPIASAANEAHVEPVYCAIHGAMSMPGSIPIKCHFKHACINQAHSNPLTTQAYEPNRSICKGSIYPLHISSSLNIAIKCSGMNQASSFPFRRSGV